VDLDQRVESLLDGAYPPAEESAFKKRKRKTLRRYDPDEEIANLRQMLEDERIKRRELEQEIYRLRQEKSEMSSKMVRFQISDENDAPLVCTIFIFADEIGSFEMQAEHPAKPHSYSRRCYGGCPFKKKSI